MVGCGIFPCSERLAAAVLASCLSDYRYRSAHWRAAGWFAVGYCVVAHCVAVQVAKLVSPVSARSSGESLVVACLSVSRFVVLCRSHGSYYAGKFALTAGSMPDVGHLLFPDARSEGTFFPLISPSGS